MKRKVLATLLSLTLLMPLVLQGTVVEGAYVGTLLRDAIAAEDADAAYDDFSVVAFPVTLFNYDPALFNDSIEGGQNNFRFMDYTGTTETVTNPANKLDLGHTALQGILADTLGEDGLPDFSEKMKSYGYGQTATPDILESLFSETAHTGKTVYSDVSFEFVYDASTGYYNYDSSANHAQYNDATRRVELYTDNLGVCDEPSGYLGGYRRGGMYVFNDISASVPALNTDAVTMTPSQWAEQIRNRQDRAYAGRVMANSLGGQADLYFAMCMELSFYLPEGGTVDGTPLKFEFAGDDDMWVFIDGQLALDIGGGHTPVAGYIDFSNGQSVTEKVVDLDQVEYLMETTIPSDESNPYEESAVQKTVDLDESLVSEGMHTLKIFYMERCGGVSNCYIKFNMPSIPAGSLVVTKDVENCTDVVKNDEFTFELLDETGAAIANEPYLINGIASGKTDANGCFTLKHGDAAVFSELEMDDSATKKVRVREVTPSGDRYDGIKINGTSVTSGLSPLTTVNAAKQSTIAFTNVRKSTTYTVKHYCQNLNGDYVEVAEDAFNGTGYVGETVTATQKTYDWYCYDADKSTASAVLTADGETTLKLYYNIASVAYTVKHHLQNLDGTGYVHQVEDDETQYGLVGAKPTFTPKGYTGFTQASVEYVPDDSIDGNGQTVVNVYYTRNTYKLTWTLTKDDTRETFTVVSYPQVKYGATLEAPTPTVLNGYEFGSWEIYPTTMPAQDLTVNGSLLRRYGDLKIEKQWSDDSTDKAAVFKVKSEKGTSLTVTVPAGRTSVVVRHLPVGDAYTVTELDWAQGYTASASKTATISDDCVVEVQFNNTAKGTLWLFGETYKDNRFGTPEEVGL